MTTALQLQSTARIARGRFTWPVPSPRCTLVPPATAFSCTEQGQHWVLTPNPTRSGRG